MTNSTNHEKQPLTWPTNRQVYLTLDFECDYGTALPENTYKALDQTDELVTILEDADIPLTCFIQTEVLEERPEAVEILRSSSVSTSFHPHSHTHAPRDETSIQREIAESTEKYRAFFGESPVGYRLPNGNVRPQDYQHLSEYDYEFDASVFPSWRPNHFDNTDQPTVPSYMGTSELFEIPFTVYSNRVRIPTALSYCRLLGRPFTELLLRRPPSVTVFNIHMHDLVNPPAFKELPPLYKTIYKRNTPGMSYLDRILTRLRNRNVSFGLIGDVYESLAE
jgi:peptidoglycan/xylan/chitin deacetylase (PgdA/CDA1 family)